MSGELAGADLLGGFAGGVLIGLAGAAMLLGAGRIAGVSGITARALGLGGGMSLPSAWMFLLGLPIGAGMVALARGGLSYQYASLPLTIAAGLLVGFGTRVGSGCTSGHGVCGVSRLSARSLVASATFLASGVMTVAVMRWTGLGW